MRENIFSFIPSIFWFLSFSFFAVFSYILPLSALAQGKGHGVEVQLTTPKLVETEPGKIITATFRVASKTEKDETFIDDLSMPPGWRRIIPPIPFLLKAGEQQLKIIAFSLPGNAPAGRYRLVYAVRSQRDYGITDFDSLEVAVLPIMKLEMLLEDKPGMPVIAGESYQAVARILNRGNSPKSIKMLAMENLDYQVKIEPAEFNLEPGTSREIRVEVKTDEKLSRNISHVLTLRAQTKDLQDKVFSVDQPVSADIIPRITGESDPYHRINSRVTFTGVEENGKTGTQAEFSGEGSLDEEETKKIDFLFRGPDIQNKSIYGLRDEYRLGYTDPNFGFRLGDWNYVLSPLTEGFRYGRGAAADFHPGKLGTGVFFSEPRWASPAETEVGTYVQYQFIEQFGLRGNFLNKTKDATTLTDRYHDQLYSLETKIKPDKQTDLALEYAQGESDRGKTFRDQAYRIDLKGGVGDQVFYTLGKNHAGPKYFGYYNDTDNAFGTMNFPIYQRLRGNFAYRSYAINLDLDPAKSTANRERSYTPGLSYRFVWGADLSTDLTLNYEDFRRKDQLSPSTYDFEEKVWKLGVGQTVGKLTMLTYVERWGLENDLQRMSNDNLQRYTIFAAFSPTDWQSYSLSMATGNERYSGTTDWKNSASLSGSWRLGSLNANVVYQKNNFDPENGQTQDNILSMISYILPNQHVIGFKSRWYKDIDAGSSFLLSYSIPLNIPIGKKKSIGTLRGMLQDGEKKDQTMANAVLTAGGVTAVTNRRGEFIFPSLKPGTYYLGVNKASIGLNRVTTEKTPMPVEIRGGETTEVNILAVNSCKISGKVTVFSLDRDRNLKEGAPLGDTLVEITDGKETLRKFNDSNGGFSFQDVRPGKWTLKIYDNNLPVHHYLEKDTFQVELKPGEVTEVEVRVSERYRPIQIIEEGVIKGKMEKEGAAK